jgi:hypothetical protein
MAQLPAIDEASAAEREITFDARVGEEYFAFDVCALQQRRRRRSCWRRVDGAAVGVAARCGAMRDLGAAYIEDCGRSGVGEQHLP